MTNICQICYDDPNGHSFVKLSKSSDISIPYEILQKNNDNIENITIFYTCLSKTTKYKNIDVSGIITHYDMVLREHGDNPWIWVFDGTNYELKHSMETDVAVNIGKFVNEKCSNNLIKIVVINVSRQTRVFFTMIKPFLNDKLRTSIEYDDRNHAFFNGSCVEDICRQVPTAL